MGNLVYWEFRIFGTIQNRYTNIRSRIMHVFFLSPGAFLGSLIAGVMHRIAIMRHFKLVNTDGFDADKYYVSGSERPNFDSASSAITGSSGLEGHIQAVGGGENESSLLLGSPGAGSLEGMKKGGDYGSQGSQHGDDTVETASAASSSSSSAFRTGSNSGAGSASGGKKKRGPG